ncbi:22030_t:CDS:2, partial [Cetraspora pellucida]
MELSASRSDTSKSAKLNVVDMFIKKNPLDPLHILAFRVLSNDELMIMTKWYHEGLKEFTIVCLKDYKIDETSEEPYEESSEEPSKEPSKSLIEELSEKLSEELFSVEYFKFIIKHLDFEFFMPEHSLNELIKSHVEDIPFFKLYAQNLLVAAISEHRIDLVDQVFNKCMESIKSNPDEINILKIITPHLRELHENQYEKLSEKKLVDKQPTIPSIYLVVPLPRFCTYEPNYSFWVEILGRPSSNGFVEIQTPELYSSWIGEALLNFKWNTFGKYCYYIEWIIFTLLLIVFSLAVTETKGLVSDTFQKLFLWMSIIIGLFFLLYIELRQLIFDWKRYLFNLWNCFDAGALIMPIATSIYWLLHGPPPPWAPSLACLFLDIKFLFFLRAFEYFGTFFAIIIGVAQQVFSYLIVLGMIILAFAHAFYILLQKPNKVYSKIMEVINNNDLADDAKPIISEELLKLAGINDKKIIKSQYTVMWVISRGG